MKNREKIIIQARKPERFPFNMKRLAHSVFAAAAMALLGSSVSAQEFSFKLHHFLGPKAPAHNAMLVPWAERIEAQSNGRIDIEIYPAMSLGGTPSELVRQVRDGVVDMVWALNGYSPGLFPRTEVFELPNVYRNNPGATNLAMADLFDEYLAQEHVGVKVLFQHVHGGQSLHMRDVEVHSLADLAGKTLRIPSRTGVWVAEALGASPVSMPIPDFPQALSRGVVDGGLNSYEIIPALQLQDLTDYQIELHEGVRFGTSVFQVSMNLDRWDSLPEDIQTIFLKNSGEEWLKEVGKIWTDADLRGLKVAIDAGNKHIVLTAEESAPFEAAAETVVERWVKEANGQNIDGNTLVEAARAGIAARSQ